METPRLDKPLKISDTEWIPQGTEITNVYTIAGNDTETKIRVADKLSELYGGTPSGWMKKVGKIASNKYEFDIHWYEHSDAGKYDFKIKYFKERA